jgi:hypothetical protein
MGERLTAESYLSVVGTALGTVAAPAGPPRRTGPADKIRDNVARVRDNLAYALSHQQPVDAVQDRCIEITSALYDAGAPHPVWRYWAGLTGLGSLLLDDSPEACLYLAVAGQWDSVAAVVAGPPADIRLLDRRCVWVLAGGRSAMSDAPLAEVDRPWPDLVDAVQAGDHARVSRDLRDIADLWISELENWNAFLPGRYPSFHPEACAAAAIARRHGFTPTDVHHDVLRFLEPGLAAGVPAPLPRVGPR